MAPHSILWLPGSCCKSHLGLIQHHLPVPSLIWFHLCEKRRRWPLSMKPKLHRIGFMVFLNVLADANLIPDLHMNSDSPLQLQTFPPRKLMMLVCVATSTTSLGPSGRMQHCGMLSYMPLHPNGLSSLKSGKHIYRNKFRFHRSMP